MSSRKRRNDGGLVDGGRRHDAALAAEVERIKRLPLPQAEQALTALIGRMQAQRAVLNAEIARIDALLAEGVEE